MAASTSEASLVGQEVQGLPVPGSVVAVVRW